MKTFFMLFDRVLKVLVEIICFVLCLIVLWQVIARFLIRHPSAWSEEIARYLLSWIAFLGGAIGIREGSHMGLVFLTERIKNRKTKTGIIVFCNSICILVGCVFVKYGYEYMMMGFSRTMQSCKIPMAYVYAVIPISGIIIIINCCRIIYNTVDEYISEIKGVKKN